MADINLFQTAQQLKVMQRCLVLEEAEEESICWGHATLDNVFHIVPPVTFQFHQNLREGGRGKERKGEGGRKRERGGEDVGKREGE